MHASGEKGVTENRQQRRKLWGNVTHCRCFVRRPCTLGQKLIDIICNSWVKLMEIMLLHLIHLRCAHRHFIMS